MSSRGKGASAEREVAALVQAWWRQLEPACIFKRTPMSGGWGHGTAARATFKTGSDLVTDAKHFPFSVEVKRREAWTWTELIAGRRSPVWGWWEQAYRQGLEADLVPMLWFRQSREEWSVMVPELTVPREPYVMWPRIKLIPHKLPAHPVIHRAKTILDIAPLVFAR